ncbi:hypothetical protein [Curtobacterium sp. HSID17257]|uniref:hypothetical protein n=1 Tax=Curtobacterium sp. HSID17257 TaxID=2419510 RepID=UPI000F8619F3|nr:hypothetical protein [Curtobacterium sp. HSID17257]RUQ09429.1 hypothetical protein D8M35_02270 [Curtobacterium sp. HSID17257]
MDLGESTTDRFYDVPAVFDRRPRNMEVDALRGSSGHRRLMEYGYSEVTMNVSDRRLIIGHTSLGQLERGLATVIATIVDNTSRESLAENERLRQLARSDHDQRADRAHDVAIAAERIRFIPMRGAVPASTPESVSKRHSLSRPAGHAVKPPSWDNATRVQGPNSPSGSGEVGAGDGATARR